MARDFHYARAGQTIQETLLQCGYSPRQSKYFHIGVDGQPIARDLWATVHLREGQLVTIRAVPAGGGGGGKGILRIVLMVALIAAAIFFAPALAAGLTSLTGVTVSAGLAGGLITAVGGLLINALIPPATPNRPSAPSRSVEQGDPLTPSITGIQNTTNQYGVIPRVYGTHRMYPSHGGTPYTELAGDDQYLVMLFLLGYGELVITDLRIGTTAIAEFTDVTTNIRVGAAGDGPLTIYTRDVFEENLNIALTNAGGWQSRTTDVNTTTISVDIACPQGLVEYTTSGAKVQRSVAVAVEYRVSSPPGSWVSAGTISLTRKTSALVRGTLKWSVSENQYDVRLQRTTADSTSNTIYDTTFWSHLRSFKDDSPIDASLTNMATIELRIKATDQLSGVIDTFNCLCQAKLQTYDGAVWGPAVATNNPAWAYVNELVGTQNKNAISTARLDGTELKAWADECATEGREYNAIHDSPGTVFERLKTIAAVGRASPSARDGFWTVIEDKSQSTPIQIFSQRNSWNFTGNKMYIDVPHAFKVQFLNASVDYQQDEIIVYDDGFDVNNATIFETMPLTGVTDSDQAWKLARYHLAVARLRPESYTLNTDMEHLVCTRGDLVRLNHDVMLVGVGAGRVKAISTSGTDVTAMEMDDAFPLDPVNSYTVQIRFPNGTITTHPIDSPGVLDNYTSVTFTTPIPNTQEQPAAGDFFLIGIAGSESLDCIIRNVEPFEGIHAKLTLIPYNEGVYTADTGTIPTYDPAITIPPRITRDIPPVPIIESIRSDESTLRRQADGSLDVQIAIGLTLPGGTNRKNLSYQVQYRETGSDAAFSQMPLQPAEVNEAFVYPVDQLTQYDIRVRTIYKQTQVSDWTNVQSHVVQGKTNPPPDVATFLVSRDSDGTRHFSWTLAETPPDLEGFLLRYKLGTDGTWSNSTALHIGALPSSPYETNQLAAGQYTLLIKAVDTSGNESANAKTIISTLGDPRLSGALIQVSCRTLGFPGSKTNCFASDDSSLHAIGVFTWDDVGLSHGKRSSDTLPLGLTEESTIVPTSP